LYAYHLLGQQTNSIALFAEGFLGCNIADSVLLPFSAFVGLQDLRESPYFPKEKG